MLRSTGFFRSIDCPYWAGAPGGPCRRPYCHFRHRGARGPGAPGSGGAASPASGKAHRTALGPTARPCYMFPLLSQTAHCQIAVPLLAAIAMLCKCLDLSGH
jgi:hypothetical protein